MDIASAIREISKAQRPVEENVELAGPGGQAYDHSPTPERDLSKPPTSPPYEGAGNKAWKSFVKVATYARKFPAPVLAVVFGVGLGIGLVVSRLGRASK